jgi:threonine dehydrogenase-like Zn-dependent dehydrogenase
MRFYSGKSPLEKSTVRGHEFGGTLKHVGSDIVHLQRGDKAAVNPAIYCDSCTYCRNGAEHLCENLVVLGGAVDGGMQEEIVLSPQNIVPLPDSFDLDYASLIEPTAFARHVTEGLSDSKVMIIGLGTIGLLCLQWGRDQRNHIAALDIAPSSLALAERFSADLVLDIRDDDRMAKIHNWQEGKAIDAVIDCVCNRETLQLSAAMLKPGGRLLLVGIPAESFPLPQMALFKEIRCEPKFMYRRADFQAAVEALLQDRISYKPLLSKRFPLSQAKEAFEYKLNESAIKVVLTCT